MPDEYNHLLVRMRQDRRLFDQEQSLYRYLKQQSVVGTYTIDVLADKRIPRVARKAWLTVRFGRGENSATNCLKSF